MAAKDPVNVCVTGAAGQIAYSLLYPIAKGDVFGCDQPVRLYLLDVDVEPVMNVLKGVVMELQDCALPLLVDVVPTADQAVAFKDCDAAFLVGAMPRKDGMERKDLLAANVKIFKAQGESLDKYAKKTVKVVVVGNPANTNAFICKHYAPSIPAENFSALTRLDHNRASSQVAMKLNISANDVWNVTIWGNHSNTQFPDVANAKCLKDCNEENVSKLLDEHWIKNEFVPTVQKRGAAVIAARKLSSAMSAAKSICDHMRDWFQGTKEGRWVSMAIISDGSYEIEKGLVFSFPVTLANGRWSIVKGLSIDDYSRKMLEATQKELIEERDLALTTCTA